MGDWFAELSAMRREWLEWTRKNDFEKGIRQSTVENYADPEVHFVYELLQNAEDQGATEALFTLGEDRLLFEHNGACFTRRDVENISGIGNTDKADQPNKIGRFGIGFKSVFAVTDRPEVYTSLGGAPLAFAIEDLVVPVPLPFPMSANPATTRFVLPFRSGEIAMLRDRIGGRLRHMGADTLLFLQNLTTIEWSAPAESEAGRYLCKRCHANHAHSFLGERVTRGCRSAQEITYLVFSRRAVVADADRELAVSIAFRVEDGRIVPEPGEPTLDVFFPTEEKTGLRFRLHAPLLLTNNRGSMKRDTPLNRGILDECAALLAESIPRLRDLGFMDVSCLECLPTGDVAYSFRCLSEAVTAALKSECVLPTDKGGYARADRVRLPRGSALRSLVSAEQLGRLMGSDGPLHWFTEGISEDTAPKLWGYLRSTVGIREVDASLLATKLSPAFLNEQTDEWMARLYGFLRDQRALWGEKGALRDNPERPIIRLEDGRQVAPFDRSSRKPNAYLPPECQTSHPTVKRRIVQDAGALEFLKQLGLQKPDVRDGVLHLLLPRYREQGTGSITDEQFQQYEQDLQQIGEAITCCPTGDRWKLRQELCDTPFVLAVNAVDPSRTQLGKPGDTYEDAPALREWFDGNPEGWFVSPSLDRLEIWKQIREFLPKDAPRRAIDVQRRKPDQDGCVYVQREKGERGKPGQHKRGLNAFDPDARIEGLEFAVQHPTIGRARTLWPILGAHRDLLGRGTVESATNQNYSNADRCETESLIWTLCTKHAWVPDRNGRFHVPGDLSEEGLPDYLDRDTALALGIRRLASTDAEAGTGTDDPGEGKAQPGWPADAAHSIGVDPERLRQIAENPDDFRRSVLGIRRKPTFPVAAPRQPDRAGRVAARAGAAPAKTYRMRLRSVRTSAGYTDEKRDAYLRHLYTNEDEQMVCQICENEMPFRRRGDGQHYFEAIECVKTAKEKTAKEHHQNYLALCPTCAAKFQHSNYTPPDQLREAVLSASGLRVPVELDRASHTIRFVETHICDLKAVLRTE